MLTTFNKKSFISFSSLEIKTFSIFVYYQKRKIYVEFNIKYEMYYKFSETNTHWSDPVLLRRRRWAAVLALLLRLWLLRGQHGRKRGCCSRWRRSPWGHLVQSGHVKGQRGQGSLCCLCLRLRLCCLSLRGCSCRWGCTRRWVLKRRRTQNGSCILCINPNKNEISSTEIIMISLFEQSLEVGKITTLVPKLRRLGFSSKALFLAYWHQTWPRLR